MAGETLAPRERLAATPYSFRASVAEGIADNTLSTLTVTGNAFSVGGSTLVVNAGNVGIGTTGPEEELEIYSSDPVLRLRDSGATATAATGYIEFGGTDGGSWNRTGYIGDASSTNADIYLVAEDGKFYLGDTSGSQVVTLSSGDVGIGDTSPDYKLDVWGTICQDTNSDDACDGTVTSDVRLKKNITEINNALELVQKLRGVRFEFNNSIPQAVHLGKGPQIGFVAQEVQQVLPELIYEDMEGYKMVDYQKMTVVLTEAVKELKNENEQLKQLVCIEHPEAEVCKK